MLMLNLGCGGDIRKGYVNIDARHYEHRPCDLIHDLRNPLPYDDNSVDEIYSHDLIQMFDRKEWPIVRKDWIRVLKHGGILKISVWDFPWVLKTFLADPDEPYNMQMIYAGQDGQFDYFKNGFTWNHLVRDLTEEGMVNFKREPYDERFIHLICQKY